MEAPTGAPIPRRTLAETTLPLLIRSSGSRGRPPSPSRFTAFAHTRVRTTDSGSGDTTEQNSTRRRIRYTREVLQRPADAPILAHRPSDVCLPRGPRPGEALGFACTSAMLADMLQQFADGISTAFGAYEDKNNSFQCTNQACAIQRFLLTHMILESHGGAFSPSALCAIDWIAFIISATSGDDSEPTGVDLEAVGWLPGRAPSHGSVPRPRVSIRWRASGRASCGFAH